MTPPPPPPPSPSRPAHPDLAAVRSSTSTPDVPTQGKSDSPGDAVFAGLDAFASAPPPSAPPSFVHPSAPDVHDDDGMQNMILELSRSGDDSRFGPVPVNAHDQDWAFDGGLNVPYFYNSETDAPNFPLNFMDPAPPPVAPVPAPPPPTPQVSLAQQQHLNMPAPTILDSHQIQLSLRERSNLLDGAASEEPDLNRDEELQLPHPVDKSGQEQQQLKSSPAFVPGSWPGRPTGTQLEHTLTSPLVLGAPTASPGTPSRRASSSRMRSPGSSTSSAPGKTRVPTAVCPVCGKNISANGANFRRHQQACRRQRAGKTGAASSASPAASPMLSAAAATFASEPARVGLQAWASGAQVQSAPPFMSPHHDARVPFDAFPNSAHAQAATQRRDTDLLAAVQRLERSISTLDVNARLCLRDALVSLSNKASNPHIMPTPEQEAMNRAAEYLVLRMLFLSGQQVMHTAPGTAGTYADPASLAATGRVSAGASSAVPQAGRSTSGNDTDDGTIAASTGGAPGGVQKGEELLISESDPASSPSPAKVEEKLGGV